MFDRKTHMRIVAAITGALARSGVDSITYGHLNDQPPHRWYAQGNWNGTRAIAEDHPNPTWAALDLAVQTIDGGKCVQCDHPTAFLLWRHGHCNRLLTQHADGTITVQTHHATATPTPADISQTGPAVPGEGGRDG